ncbi:hypothetical protein PV08_08163 [Exophiala spinifera]|uniref:C2H2-type domain-containing protein n=1 Tax=Exophiala spinifera TaxID=91928 RepID=A0A0D1YDD9_9EURO|nr:uncharacterized protein PV08_08163 [Exophiala spinifera]KIW12976.1 hypothetical protein PV08_08163 [Exophiala spinifera]
MANNDRVGGFSCSYPGCGKVFKAKSTLTTHVKGIHEDAYICKGCGTNFKDPSNLRRHLAKCAKASTDDKAKASASFICVWRSCRYSSRRDNVIRHHRTCKLKPEGLDAAFSPLPLRLSEDEKEQVKHGQLPATIKQIGQEDLPTQQEAPGPQVHVENLGGAFFKAPLPSPESLGNPLQLQEQVPGQIFQVQNFDGAFQAQWTPPEAGGNALLCQQEIPGPQLQVQDFSGALQAHQANPESWEEPLPRQQGVTGPLGQYPSPEEVNAANTTQWLTPEEKIEMYIRPALLLLDWVDGQRRLAKAQQPRSPRRQNQHWN